jgi:23S rRNA (cytidine2498-2'-O)-methyltransferase
MICKKNHHRHETFFFGWRIVNQEQLLIVTAHAEFLDVALNELRRLDKGLRSIAVLVPGIALCANPDITALMRLAAKMRPIFVRHLAPVQVVIDLSNTEHDVGKLALAIASLPGFKLLERGIRFAVQTRLLQTGEDYVKRPYSSGHLNQVLAEAIAEETGAIESIKKPQVVVSLLCTAEKAYVGISTTEENLSDWPGGMRHFAQTPEQISRAEFKLLEALEVFGLTLPEQGWALDLGAAPGGWTRLLLEAGLNVVAVDPATLDPRLVKHPRLEHYRGYAKTYLEEAAKRRKRFDVITNDVRTDAREAARLLVQARKCLYGDSIVITTLKLPHATREIDPLRTLKEALSLLNRHYGIVQARQLFHNRQEVTVVMSQPLAANL